MVDAKEMDRDNFLEEFGACNNKVPVPSEVKSNLLKQKAELEKEDKLPNSLTYGHALQIILDRADSLKEMREDSEIRGVLKQ